jgi:hypothetical protein
VKKYVQNNFGIIKSSVITINLKSKENYCFTSQYDSIALKCGFSLFYGMINAFAIKAFILCLQRVRWYLICLLLNGYKNYNLIDRIIRALKIARDLIFWMVFIYQIFSLLKFNLTKINKYLQRDFMNGTICVLFKSNGVNGY